MISILHPSRSRPEFAYKAYRNWVDNLSGRFDFEYIISIDNDDPRLKDYFDIFDSRDMHFCVQDNQNCVQASNAAAKVSQGEILVLISDDFECKRGWDLLVHHELSGKSGLLKTYDGVQKWIVTLPIMTRDYYESNGYIYHPAYFHQFADTDQTHLADIKGKLIVSNHITFTHNHYSTGRTPKDAVNVKADSTWDHGKKIYLQRCRDHFGLGNNVDIFNLSDTASNSGHINWLKNELKKSQR